MTASKDTNWQFTGDVNWAYHGGKWYRRTTGRQYQVIEITNMDEACGRDNEGEATYVVELSLVDLDMIPDEAQDSAWKSCGWDDSEFTPTHGAHETENSARNTRTAIACFEYGCKAPLGSWSGNGYSKLLREARKEAHALKRDSQKLADLMEKPVNRIGSTAAEFMAGDISSAIMRGVAQGNVAAEIMLKMEMVRK